MINTRIWEVLLLLMLTHNDIPNVVRSSHNIQVYA